MTTLDLQVITTSDNDAYEGSGGDPNQYLTDTSCYFGWRFGSVPYSAGFRFTGVTVPVGATINTATLELFIQRTNTAALLIKGEAADNPGSFAGTHVLARTRTSASVGTSAFSGTSAWVVGPDIKTVIQEIVNRGGWASGNALVVFVDNNSSSDYSQCTDYTGGSSNTAKLHIDYTAAAATGPATGLVSA